MKKWAYVGCSQTEVIAAFLAGMALKEGSLNDIWFGKVGGTTEGGPIGLTLLLQPGQRAYTGQQPQQIATGSKIETRTIKNGKVPIRAAQTFARRLAGVAARKSFMQLTFTQGDKECQGSFQERERSLKSTK